MTSVDHVTRILPGSPEWADLLDQIGAGATDRGLHDENPFDQVAALKRAGFGTLRLPEHRERRGIHCATAVLHSDRRRACRSHCGPYLPDALLVRRGAAAHCRRPQLGTAATQARRGQNLRQRIQRKGSLAVGSLVFNTRLLPADRDGERLIDDRDGFGQRRTGTTVFTNVAVSNDEVLSDTPYDAAPVPTVQHASLQLFIHAVVAGIPASVVDDGIALLRSRDRSFSHALAERPTDDPLYQKQLGELASTAYIAKAAVLDAAEAIAAATASEIDGVPDARLAAVPDARLAAVPDARLAAVPDAQLAAVPDAQLAAVPDAQLAAVPDA